MNGKTNNRIDNHTIKYIILLNESLGGYIMLLIFGWNFGLIMLAMLILYLVTNQISFLNSKVAIVLSVLFTFYNSCGKYNIMNLQDGYVYLFKFLLVICLFRLLYFVWHFNFKKVIK